MNIGYVGNKSGLNLISLLISKFVLFNKIVKYSKIDKALISKMSTCKKINIVIVIVYNI